jgi:hypothetical protein
MEPLVLRSELCSHLFSDLSLYPLDLSYGATCFQILVMEPLVFRSKFVATRFEFVATCIFRSDLVFA